MAALSRQIAPQLALHASTQLTVHSLEGVRELAALGFSCVVLSRELPREEIAYICRNSPVRIEVFAHGALCMCYSGQCYMSAVIGRRSGNRGQCAQPCRLPYGYGRFENRYPMSLKDNCLIRYLGELARMGVASLKLEGRMKRPEYVAIVTGIYRAALDGREVRSSDLSALRAAFSSSVDLGMAKTAMMRLNAAVSSSTRCRSSARTACPRSAQSENSSQRSSHPALCDERLATIVPRAAPSAPI